MLWLGQATLNAILVQSPVLTLACCMHIAQCLDALEPLMCGHVDQTGESIMLDCEHPPPPRIALRNLQLAAKGVHLSLGP